MAGTDRNRYEEVSNALLVTEYNDLNKTIKEMEKRKKEMRDEIERRIDEGMTVANSKLRAEVVPVEYKTYNVNDANKAIKKYKLDAGSMLKVVNKMVEALPSHIRESISYVTETGRRLVLKPND